MNAPASFILDGARLHPEYIRLFGLIPPAQVFASVDPLCSSRDDGNLSPPPILSCDPKEAAAGPFPFPSARTLADIAALRARHVEKGHTPEADAAHGWLHFKHKAEEAYSDAISARSPETRRKRLIIAAAILVAQIDAEDFATQQQEPTP